MFLWLAAPLALLSACLVMATRATTSRNSQAKVKLLGFLLSACAVASLISLFIAVPERGPAFKLVLWIHRAAFTSLFFFLLAGNLYQWEAARQVRSGQDAALVARTMRRFAVLSELAPAPIALTIFLTGLRLIWELPVANTPAAVWLLVLIVGFSLFFFDGILGYQPIVRRMCGYWAQAADEGVSASMATQRWHANSDRAQLLAHCLSWPVLFLFGAFRWDFTNPSSTLIARLEHRLMFLPEGWPGVITAVALWAATGVLVAVARSLLAGNGPRGQAPAELGIRLIRDDPKFSRGDPRRLL